MAATSVQDQVAALLSRKVAEQKVRGVPVPEVEATALFESIAINLATHPKSVLYLAWLARNGLLKALGDELVAVGELLKALDDLGNVAYTVKDPEALERARVALVQIESQDRLLAGGSTFGRFDRAVGEFLDVLSRNVVAPGATELTRPAPEAQLDVATLYGALEELHDEVLERLFSLVVGIDNFVSSPVLSILGISTVQAVREDIESMISDMAAGDAAAQSRDFAVRLLAGRAALKVLGQPVQIPDDGSALCVMWQELKPAVESVVSEVLASDFGTGLRTLDLAVAGLTENAAEGQIAEARRVLTSLQALLQNGVTALQVTPPTGCADERRVVNGILESLEERRYDRAVAMLLRCRIAEMFELDWQTASFGGSLMKAASDLGRTDLIFPKRENDETTLTLVRGE